MDSPRQLLMSRACGLAAMVSVVALGAAAQAPSAYKPPKLIDYSPKHDVLIRSDDGALTPMDQPYYQAKLIAPGTWQIESDGDYHYLLEGDDQALAIDTGYGAGNVREYLQTLTRKPVRFVANTHDHFDHTALNGYFDGAYMSAETAKKATIPFASFTGISFPQDYPKIIVSDSYKIQLGNREIEVFLAPNHTAGGTVYLDRKQRILFSGDEIMGANQPLNVSVERFADNMKKLAAHRGEFDRAAGGPGIFDGAVIDKYVAAADAVLSGAEGVAPMPRPPGAPAAAPADPNGPVIYQRRRVRAPDRPASLGAVNGNSRSMAYQDIRINYDIRRIRD
jgi:glyoxylase-like metal-dependent hydrolase (beta-lactamase superfamily II)